MSYSKIAFSFFRCHPLTGFLNIDRFHNFPADQTYRVLLPSTNAYDVASPDKLSSIWHLSRDHRKLYFTNSGVECLARPQVPASHVPESHIPESHIPESHIPESHIPESQSHVPVPFLVTVALTWLYLETQCFPTCLFHVKWGDWIYIYI